MVQAGKYRHRIQLQQATETRDATGGVTRTWTTIVTRWAEILPLRGDERFAAAQTEAATNVKIRIRYYSAIDTTWRIYWPENGKYYNIESIVNIGERNFAMEINCIETKGSKG